MFRLDSEIKTAWLKQIREDWKNANYTNFRNRMKLPDFDLSNSIQTLGKWEGKNKRRLSISIVLIENFSWQYVQEILYHEMAHQYVEEILLITDDLPHGKAFKKVCYENGFNHRAVEDIQQRINGKTHSKVYSRNYKMLDKVQKLLSLAQSANRFEAESAMAKAREILLRHNLSLLEADSSLVYTHKQIGSVKKRNPVKSLIGSILNKFFFVEALWVFGYDQKKNKKGRILEIYGTPENVEMAEYVYNYLSNISEALWKEYKDSNNIIGNKHRRSYTYGLLNGFYKKLDTKPIHNNSKNLVWKGDPGLKSFYRRRNPKITHSASQYSKTCQEAYNSGINRGKTLVIHKGINAVGSENIRLLT